MFPRFETDWMLRNRMARRQQQPDTFSLYEQGPYSTRRGLSSDGMSVQSLNILRNGPSSSSSSNMKPVILPRWTLFHCLVYEICKDLGIFRKSLMKQNKETTKTTGDKSCEEPRKQWRLDLILMFCSVLIGFLIISWAFVMRHRCDSNSSLTFNLSKLNNDLESKIIGQKLSIDKIKGKPYKSFAKMV